MQDQASRNRSYLEERLHKFGNQHKLSFEFVAASEPNYWNVIITAETFHAVLYTDFISTMEITVNDYYREVTDYTLRQFQDTSDWYLEIIENLSTNNFKVIEYTRMGKDICKYLQMEVRGKYIQIGDFKNHLKLFTKKRELPADQI